MDIKKRCQWCGEPFIAHKMTTLYCSKLCIDRAYKAKEKEKIKEDKFNAKTNKIIEMKQFVIKAYDGEDKLDKRMEVRPHHFEGMEKMKEHILCARGLSGISLK